MNNSYYRMVFAIIGNNISRMCTCRRNITDCVVTLKLHYNMVWKNIKKCLGIAALGLGVLVSRADAGSDEIELRDLAQSGVGGTLMYLQHIDGSTETNNPDIYDSTWDSALPNPNSKWLKIYTEPYNVQLQRDARPTNSETIFKAKLTPIDASGGNVTTTNRLRFVYTTKDSTRFYLAKINCDSNWTPNGQPFSWVGVPTNNQYVNLPGIVNCPSGTVYGTVDFDPSFNKLVSSSTSG